MEELRRLIVDNGKDSINSISKPFNLLNLYHYELLKSNIDHNPLKEV